MLQRLILLIGSLSLVSLSLPAQDYSKIDPYLQDQIDANESQTYHSVNILLVDRVDVRQMDIRFYEKNTPLEDRAYEVITNLKAKAQATQSPLLSLLNNQAGVRAGSVNPLWITNLIQADLTVDAIEELSQRSDIDMIEYDYPLESLEFQRAEATSSPNGIENGLAAIKAPFMWSQGYTGYGRKSLTVDTGVDPAHDALKARFWANFVPLEEAWFSPGSTEDCNGHGSHVTGTILGLDESNNDTIGVAFGALWMGTAAIDCGPANPLAAYQWALDPDNDPTTIGDMPDVINNSWGFPTNISSYCTGAWVSTLDAMEAAGIAVVFAAGNEGFLGASSVRAPAVVNTDLVNSFSVGNLNGNVPSFPINGGSSQGPTVCGGTGSLEIKPEVSAPGTNVRSSIPGNGYALFTGTSMASPHVAGAVLLLKEAFPSLTGTEIKLALYFSAIDLGPTGEDNLYGMGMIDLESAYNYLKCSPGHNWGYTINL
ncbi:MAG: S8 family serine peptidase [Bacteroidota bacterium]